MTEESDKAKLFKLSESELTLKSPNDDIRNRKIFDDSGEEIGIVEDLLADESEREVRRVGQGSRWG